MTAPTLVPAGARRAGARRAAPGRAAGALAGCGIAAVLVGRTWPGLLGHVQDGHVRAVGDLVSPVLLVLGTVALTLATVWGGLSSWRTPSRRTRRSAGR